MDGEDLTYEKADTKEFLKNSLSSEIRLHPFYLNRHERVRVGEVYL